MPAPSAFRKLLQVCSFRPGISGVLGAEAAVNSSLRLEALGVSTSQSSAAGRPWDWSQLIKYETGRCGSARLRASGSAGIADLQLHEESMPITSSDQCLQNKPLGLLPLGPQVAALPDLALARICRHGRALWTPSIGHCRQGHAQGGSVPADSDGAQTSELEFHRRADSTLHALHEQLDAIVESAEDSDAYDCDFSDGVLTLRLGRHGVFVVNKQAPNQQLWLSSPVSGPGRFAWEPASLAWMHTRIEGTELCELLQKELSTLLQDSNLKLFRDFQSP